MEKQEIQRQKTEARRRKAETKGYDIIHQVSACWFRCLGEMAIAVALGLVFLFTIEIDTRPGNSRSPCVRWNPCHVSHYAFPRDAFCDGVHLQVASARW